MSFRRLNVAWVLTGMVAMAGFMAAHAQQQIPSGARKIEFSTPRGSLLSSNLNEIANQKTPPQNLEDDLKSPNELFRPSSSLQGIGAPVMHRAPASAVKSKRLKELLEDRQDWQFLEAEDYHPEPTLEELFGVPEYSSSGEMKEKKSPLERYYERMDRANTAVTNRTNDEGLLMGVGFGAGKKNDGRTVDLTVGGLEHESGTIPEIDNPVIQLFRGNSGNPLFPERMRPAGSPDMFRQFNQWDPASSAATRAQEARIEEFRRILDSQTLPSLPSALPVSGLTQFNPLDPSSASSAAPAFALPKRTDPAPVAPFTPARDSFTAFPTAAGTTPPSFDLPEVSKSLPGLTTPPTPSPEPTRTVVPAPDFNIPKRRFN